MIILRSFCLICCYSLKLSLHEARVFLKANMAALLLSFQSNYLWSLLPLMLMLVLVLI